MPLDKQTPLDKRGEVAKSRVQDARFPKELRVVRGDDFTRVLRKGGCAADGTIVVFALARTERAAVSPVPNSPSPNSSAVDHSAEIPTRLGVTIPKKTGNAVVRNRWKRWIRESFRTQRGKIPMGYDLIVRPKKDADPDGKTIQKNLPKLALKAIARIRKS